MEIAFSAVRISTPLVFAALGGLLTYQAGMLNIALDGFMIVAAFTAIGRRTSTGSLELATDRGIRRSSVAARGTDGNVQHPAARQHLHCWYRGHVSRLRADCAAPQRRPRSGRRLHVGRQSRTFNVIRLPYIDQVPVLGDILLSGHTHPRLCRLPPRPGRCVGRSIGPMGAAPQGRGRSRGRGRGRRHQCRLAQVPDHDPLGLFCGLAGAYLSLAYVTLFSSR